MPPAARVAYGPDPAFEPFVLEQLAPEVWSVATAGRAAPSSRLQGRCGHHLLPGSHKDHTPAILARGRECRRVGLGTGGGAPGRVQVVRTLPYRA